MKLRCVCALALTLGGAVPARADVTFSLAIRREMKPAYEAGYGQTQYYAWPFLSDTTSPLSHHRVESPTDICSANFGTNTGSSALVFNNANQLLNALTNGDWKLWLNRDTPQEELYTFTLTTGVITSNSLGPVVILAPANGGINVASNSPYTWTGPPGFDSINVSNRNATGTSLAATETSWPAGPTLNPGTNFFSVTYGRDATADYAVSTPTNDLVGLLTNWTVGFVTLQSSAESGFIVEGLPPTPLGFALDAPGMIWETDGAANWFLQSTNTTDGVDAAQSGPIADYEFTTLRTIIYGTNTISFAWRVDCEDSADYIEFSDNGYVTDLTGSTSWEQFTHQLTDNVVHVLEWTYIKDESVAEGADAAFLDQVRLGPNTLPTGPPLQLNLTIRREQKPAHDPLWPNQLFFCVQPSLDTTNPPLSYHEVRSPNSWYIATIGPTNTGTVTTDSASFEDLLSELSSGDWSLWLNRETPQEQYFEFTINPLSLASNDLAEIYIAAPVNDSNSISPYVSYQWTGGWAVAAELHVSAYLIDSNNSQFTYASELLFPTSATNWPAGPLLAEGTNYFQVRYTKAAPTNCAVSTPFTGWTIGAVKYQSLATASFTVSNAAPVQLLNPQISGGNCQFEFLSQIGFTNIVQSRTNLILGDWVNRTNILGDGTLKTVILPISTEPTEFFRIATE